MSFGSGFRLFLTAYVLGGLTFIPLSLALVIYVAMKTSPQVEPPLNRQNEEDIEASSRDGTGSPSSTTAFDPPEEIYGLKVSDCLEAHRSGWIIARREFTVKLPESTYAGLLAQGYRSFIDARSTKETQNVDLKDKSTSGQTPSTSARTARKPGSFFAVLKRHTLYLYENEDQVDCAHVVQLGLHSVFIHPKGLSDAELFLKRHAICIEPKAEVMKDAVPSTDNQVNSAKESEKETTHFRPWYLFTSNPSDKEDWYFSLVVASRLAAEEEAKLGGKKSVLAESKGMDRSIFSSLDMKSLLDNLDATPEQLPTRWLNALLGRVFFGLYRTEWLERYIINRIEKKIARVKTPSFLSDLKVREVFAGTSTPMLSRPMLRELAEQGNATVEVGVTYHGDVRIVMEAVATFNLGSRFKPYTVKLVLAIRLKELEGTVQIKIKRPPSNRIWFAFTQPPRMSLSVEPVVSTRQIKWSMVLRAIETRITETMVESIVLPNMDDISFFNTRATSLRGGIWGDLARKERNEDGTVKAEETESPADRDSDGQKDGSLGGLRQRKGNLAEHTDGDLGSGRPKSADAAAAKSGTNPTKKKSWFSAGTKTNTKTTLSDAATLESSIDNSIKSSPRSGSPAPIERSSTIAVSSNHSSQPIEGFDPPDLARKADLEDEIASNGGLTLELTAASSAMTSARDRSRSASKESKVSVDTNATDEKFGPPPRHGTAAVNETGDPNGPPARSGTLYQSWKSKANQVDRQAVQASVSQAKDTMKKWGASWTAKKSIRENPGYYPGKVYGAGHPIPVADQAGERSTDSVGSEPASETYKDYRRKIEVGRESSPNPAPQIARVKPPAVDSAALTLQAPTTAHITSDHKHEESPGLGVLSGGRALSPSYKAPAGSHQGWKLDNDDIEARVRASTVEDRPIQTDQYMAYSPPSMMIPGHPTSPRRRTTIATSSAGLENDTMVKAGQSDDTSMPVGESPVIEIPKRRDASPSSSRSRADTFEGGSPSISGGHALGMGMGVGSAYLPGSPSLVQTTTLNASGSSSGLAGSPPRSVSAGFLPSLKRNSRTTDLGSEAARDILQRLVSAPVNISPADSGEDTVSSVPKTKPAVPTSTKPKAVSTGHALDLARGPDEPVGTAEKAK